MLGKACSIEVRAAVATEDVLPPDPADRVYITIILAQMNSTAAGYLARSDNLQGKPPRSNELYLEVVSLAAT